jgi:predicted flap endonuclease-1-like 5' DNA nuclease
VIADCRTTFQPLAALQYRLNALTDVVEGLRNEIAELRERLVPRVCCMVRVCKVVGNWLGVALIAPERRRRSWWPQGERGAAAAHERSADTRLVHPDEGAADAHAAAEEDHINEALAKLPADATPEKKANAVGARPLALEAPRSGADELQRIKGVGPVTEKHLHDLGVFYFNQIAAWTQSEIRWVGTYLAFPGRIDREQWVAQAANLARGGTSPKDGGTHDRHDVKSGH